MGSTVIDKRSQGPDLVEWGHTSGSPRGAAATPEPGPREPKDCVAFNPTPKFKESSRSLKRDAFYFASMLMGKFLPIIGSFVGPVVGVAGAAAACGEIREGIRTKDMHQVLDGAAHMGMSALVFSSAFVSSPLLVPGMVLAGSLLTLAKVLYDHPKGAADFLLKEGGRLFRDAFRSGGVEMQSLGHKIRNRLKI